MVFENPNDRAMLEVELEKYGLSLKQFEDVVDSVVPIISQAVKIATEIATEIAAVVSPTVHNVMQCTIDANPKYYHYYKHAKKLRTRKKYRNKLLRNATAVIEKGALI